MRCIFNSSTDAYFNLAVEEFLLKNLEDNVFMLWKNEPSVIVGRFQNSLAEINLDYVNEKNIKVVRRLTGGGAVFHDFGNLNFTFIDNQGQGDFRTFTQPILELLRSLGVDARFEGRNDLMIDGQKFSGNAQCKHGKRVMHHGTLLFSTEMTDLSEALKVNPLKFVDKAVKSVRKRVTNISSHLPKPLSVDQFADLLMNYILQTRSNSYLQPFTPEEIAQIKLLRDNKYSTWNWNFGTSPRYDFSKIVRTKGGNLEVHLQIEKGVIEAVKIFGDFFAFQDISELENCLIHTPHEKNSLSNLLKSIEVEKYLLNISVEEFVDALF